MLRFFPSFAHLLLFGLLVCGGCRPTPRESAAVQKLEKQGVRLKPNEEGRIVTASFYSLADDGANPNDLQALGELTHLEEIVVVESSAFDDRVLTAAETLPRLQKVELIRCPVSDRGLKSLAGCTELTHLTLAHTPLEGSAFETLAKLPRLAVLKIVNNEITAAGLNGLTKLTTLKRLSLEAPQLELRELKGLEKLHQIEFLDLRGTPLDDADLKPIAPLQTLRQLQWDADRMTDKGLKHLSRLHHLEFLDMSNSKITDAGLSHLRNLQELQTLNLQYCESITDEGLKEVGRLQSLRSINFSGTNVRGTGFPHLHSLPQLRFLYVNEGQIDDTFANQLVQAIPGAQVELMGEGGDVRVIASD